MKMLDLPATLVRLYKSRNSVEVRSSPGQGKSEGMDQASDMLNEIYKDDGGFGSITQMLGTFDAPDVRGYMVPSKDELGQLIARFTRPSWFPDDKMPKRGVIKFDEFGQASHDVQKPAADVLLNGRIGDFQLPEGWVVWAASNRTSDRSGVVKDLMFITNRRLLLNIQPDMPSWVDWAEKNHIHPLTMAFARKNPGVVFSDVVPDKDGPFPTPRSIVKMTQDLVALGTNGDMALDRIGMEVAAGWIGEGAAAQFATFCRLADDLPDFEDIIADPEGTTVPSRPDAAFILAQMMGAQIDQSNVVPALAYLSRMAKDTQVLAVKSVLRRDPTTVEVPEFAQWVATNQKIIRAAH